MTEIPQWNLPKPKPRKAYVPRSKKKKKPKKLTPEQERWVKDEIIAKQLSWLRDEMPVYKSDK